ncbi:hypothetical protein D6827_01900 [Candidatus Parcubacteria bacterium]|nr:MAG: hypothetical protein D6827_01900 [Candidatus Parcubacteria bacterium]
MEKDMAIDITLAQMINEVKAEIAMREKVYMRRVYNGKMSMAEADYKIAIMKKVLSLLSEINDNISHGIGDLAACPFCGSRALVYGESLVDDDQSYVINCECGCQVVAESKEIAVKKWNQRFMEIDNG